MPNMRLSNKLKQWRDSDVSIKRWGYHVAKVFWRVLQFVSNPANRSSRIVEWRFGEQYFQRASYTSPNRYPALFDQCKVYLGANRHLKILSYGCSTGEEVFTLGEYMPDSDIVGADINGWCIRQCNKRRLSRNHSFCLTNSREFKNADNFDAIFCMAVFQRSENRASPGSEISIGFKFDQFEREIGMLDAKLRRLGLLFIDHTDFNFEDTVHSSHYRPLEFDGNRIEYKRPLFDRNNRKVSDTQRLHRVFVKQ